MKRYRCYKHYSAFQLSEVHRQIPDFSKKSGILLEAVPHQPPNLLYSLNPSLHRYTENPMSALFRRIQPAKKFRITKRQIAKFLRIPQSIIVNVEC